MQPKGKTGKRITKHASRRYALLTDSRQPARTGPIAGGPCSGPRDGGADAPMLSSQDVLLSNFFILIVKSD
jgi:hypothetical protein